jgi:hypothetical protein
MRTPANKLFIGGLDPGLASGGLTVLKLPEEAVVFAASLVEKKGQAKEAAAAAQEIADDLGGWGDKEFIAAVIRAELWAEKLDLALTEFKDNHGPIDYLAMESFVDQRSRAREEKARLIRNRWHTPLATGLVLPILRQHDISLANSRLVFQNAGIVIRQLADEIGQLKRRKNKKEDIVIAGDHQITNDHLRKALAHALALSLRIREKSST